MSTETLVAIAALVVALIALLVAAVQLAQQILATAYVVRKCDRLVAGGMTRGARRAWYWRQFRFSVRYEALVFSLPRGVYAAVGVSPGVLVSGERGEVWERVFEGRGGGGEGRMAQGCWVTFVQDMVGYIPRECVGTRWESGDRIPEDLTVAPVQVDVLTVLLVGVAAGMRCLSYNPIVGELNMSGKCGSISSSVHPILGGLLHYTPAYDSLSLSADPELARLHAKALCNEKAVWAHAIFGLFQYRGYLGRGFEPLRVLQARQRQVLLDAGYPPNSVIVSIDGACSFLVFGYVDCYLTVPASSAANWTAHFAEVIVKAHLKAVAEAGTSFISTVPEEALLAREKYVDDLGASSPYEYSDPILSHHWDPILTTLLSTLESTDPTTTPFFFPHLASPALHALATDPTLSHPKRDPSTFLPAAPAFAFILWADHLRAALARRLTFATISDCNYLVGKLVRGLAEAGAPSWATARGAVEDWVGRAVPAVRREFEDEFRGIEKVRGEEGRRREREDPGVVERDLRFALAYGELTVLRAAYYSVMMRREGFVGVGIEEGERIMTTLAYMA